MIKQFFLRDNFAKNEGVFRTTLKGRQKQFYAGIEA